MWSKVKFGKHHGKTLPQVILSDPDWFFWAIEKGVFDNWPALRDEANDILQKASRIKINKPDPKNWQIEYITQSDGKFARFEVIKSTKASHVGSSISARDTHLDLSFVRRRNAYDKRGNKRMLRSFKYYFFGKGAARLTKERCEAFFSNAENFVDQPRSRLPPRRKKYG
jgi:hypothetical protein